MNAELLKLALGAQRRSILIWGAALFALVLSILAVWPSMSESGSLDTLVSEMPPDLVSALGLESLASAAGFINGNLYALLLPVLLATLGILHVQALTAGDEDAGRMELLFALPVSRVSVYLNRFVAVVLALAAVALVVGGTVGFGGASLGMALDGVGVIAATVSIFLFATFHAAVALAFAGVGMRGSVVLAASFAVLITGYLVYAVFPMIASMSHLAVLSPWDWALGNKPLENRFDGRGIAILIGAGSMFVAVGLFTIRRRTIRTP